MSHEKSVTPSPDGLGAQRRRPVDFFLVVAADKVKHHQVIKRAMKKLTMNHMVSSVFNGEQLLSLLLKKDFYHTEYAGEPDMVLLDLTMPVMDGVKVLREIMANPELSNLVIWILDEHHDPQMRQAAEELNAAGFIETPLSEEKILEAVNSVVRR